MHQYIINGKKGFTIHTYLILHLSIREAKQVITTVRLQKEKKNPRMWTNKLQYGEKAFFFKWLL